jgi:hypothetical protein
MHPSPLLPRGSHAAAATVVEEEAEGPASEPEQAQLRKEQVLLMCACLRWNLQEQPQSPSRTY